MKRTFFARHGLWILLVAGVMLPPIIFGVDKTLRSNNNDVRLWLPKGFAETQRYDWFVEHFGSEEMAVVSWPGCTLDDPRLERLAAALAPWTEGSAAASADKTSLFHRVVTGPELLRELTSEPLSLSHGEAMRRLAGSLIGPDGQTTALLALVNEAGAADRHAALDLLTQTAQTAAGVSPAELRLGGPTVQSVALDNESERSRSKLAALSVVVALALAWRCLRKLRLVLIVFAVALFCTASSVSMIYFTGGHMSLLLVTMPSLIFVLTISGAIHLANYYHNGLATHGSHGAVERAILAGLWPCTLSGLTTVVGLGSLCISDVAPVKNFGFYSAIGILISLPGLFLLLPAALQWLSWKWDVKGVEKGIEAAQSKPTIVTPTRPRWGHAVSGALIRHHGLVVAACLGLSLLVGAGLTRLTTSVKLLNLFSPQSRIIQDYTWLERHVGPLEPIEVVLQFGQNGSLSMLERAELVQEVQTTLNEMEIVGGTISALTFAPSLPEGGRARQTIRRRIVEKSFVRSHDDLVASQHLSEGEAGQLWRVGARVQALNGVDYGHFIDQVQERIDPILAAANQGDHHVRAYYTGVVPLIYKAQHELLNDLVSSFLSAFVLVGGMMTLLLRGLRAGLVSMLPNIFPVVLIFGAMGWMGRLCDIGAMMTASVALGIAVDDTIHYLSWFRRGIEKGLSRHEAIRDAYEHCAAAMVQTSVVCGLGVLVFGLSTFVPTASFASLMFFMVVTALVGDLIFLPALLSGPLGRYFETSEFAWATQQLGSLKARLHDRWTWQSPTPQPAPLADEAVA